jgi:NADH-quinone oxidoreductase subunit L
MIVNRVGDFGLSLGIFFLFSVFKTLDYTTISQLAGQIKQQYYFFGPYEISIMDLICFFIFIGCVGKSAQIGLHT